MENNKGMKVNIQLIATGLEEIILSMDKHKSVKPTTFIIPIDSAIENVLVQVLISLELSQIK